MPKPKTSPIWTVSNSDSQPPEIGELAVDDSLLGLQLHLLQILQHLSFVVRLIGELGAVARRDQVHRGAEQGCRQQPLANQLRITAAPAHQQQQDWEQGVGKINIRCQ